MKFTLRPSLLIYLLSFSSLGSAFSQQTSAPTEKEIKRAEKLGKKVPADFNPEKHILLFLEMPRRNSSERSVSITNKLDKAIKGSWPYKYEIVSPAEIFDKGSKYSDTAIYKYAVLNSLSSYRHENVIGNPRSGEVTVNSIDFCFYDRATNKKYEYSEKNSSFIGLTTRGFIEMIKEAKGIKK